MPPGIPVTRVWNPKTQAEHQFTDPEQIHRQLVWDCRAKSELLDKWFAPKPFTTKTKSMAFKEGGRWIYAMVDPDGKE